MTARWIFAALTAGCYVETERDPSQRGREDSGVPVPVSTSTEDTEPAADTEPTTAQTSQREHETFEWVSGDCDMSPVDVPFGAPVQALSCLDDGPDSYCHFISERLVFVLSSGRAQVFVTGCVAPDDRVLLSF
jgi:hypothetical protein